MYRRGKPVSKVIVLALALLLGLFIFSGPLGCKAQNDAPGAAKSQAGSGPPPPAPPAPTGGSSGPPDKVTIDPRTGQPIDPEKVDLPFVPAVLGSSDPAPAAIMDRLATKVKNPEDIPGFYTSTVFTNSLLSSLETTDQMVIADIGAGTGALPVFFMLRKKPFAKFFLTDISKPSLEVAEAVGKRYFPEHASKIEVVNATPIDQRLPAQSIDLAVINDGNFFVPKLVGDKEALAKAVASLRTLRAALKPTGRLFVYQSQPWSEGGAPVGAPGPGEPLPAPTDEQGKFQKQMLEQIGAQFKSAGFKIANQEANQKCGCYVLELTP
jgi:SAM-dependent methyltransferase